jgi:hypothetical protein
MTTEVFIKKIKLDLYEDIDFSLNYAIADIREIDKLQSNFSYTITVPGTRNNATIFGNIYELGNDNIIFNPNKKAECQVWSEGNLQFDGFVQLNKIIRTGEEKVEYEITLLSSVGDLLGSIGSKFLEDLDFSEYNHMYSKSAITNSWTGNIVSFSANTVASPGKGYVYPQIYYGYDTNGKYDVEDWYPAFYVKEYIDKIFEQAGYSYNSQFLNSDYFRSLIIPFTKDKIYLTDEQLKQRMFYVNRLTLWPDLWRSGMQYSFNKVNLGFDNDSVAPAFDPNNLFPTVGDTAQTLRGRYIVNKKGRYQINAFVPVNVQYQLRSDVPFQTYFIPSEAAMAPFGYVLLRRNGVTVYQQQLTFQQPSGGQLGIATTPTVSAQFSYDLNLNPGDEVRLQFDFYVPMAGNRVSNAYSVSSAPLQCEMRFQVGAGAYFYNVPYNDGLTEGEQLLPNQTLPDNIKQVDFFKSICNMFNLLVIPDANKDKSVLIEPRDDYYNSGGVVKDWSAKLDRNTRYEILPMSELDFKEYVYTYSKDEDEYNKKYFDEQGGDVYGYRRNIIDNDFLENESKTELIFSPTPGARDFSNLNRSVPMFLSLDATGNPKPRKGNIRILFYKGLKTGSFLFGSALGGDQTFQSYPYCGMLDDPLNPSESLVFGEPKVTYFPQQTWTDSNLFNKFHATTFKEISDKNSKMLIGYFYLTTKDIEQLDFRDRIYVDGTYWRINRVENYNPIAPSVTKVELIALLTNVAFSPTIKPTRQGPLIPSGVGVEVVDLTGSTWSQNRVMSNPNEIGPIFTDPVSVQTNGTVSSSPGSSVVLGSDNTIGTATAVVVNGSGINIGSNVDSTLVFGDNVTVASDVQNVFVFGADDIDVTQSNTIYFGNEYIITSGSSIIPRLHIYDGGLNEVQNPFNVFLTTDILDGGENANRQYGSCNTIFIVDSGTDTVNPT